MQPMAEMGDKEEFGKSCPLCRRRVGIGCPLDSWSIGVEAYTFAIEFSQPLLCLLAENVHAHGSFSDIEPAASACHSSIGPHSFVAAINGGSPSATVLS